MSVWLTPDLKPFVGGTYFPPEDRYGQPGFKKVLERIAAAWKQSREKISEQGSKIIDALRESQMSQTTVAAGATDAGALQAAYEQFDRTFDPQEGGFGIAPKFPRPVALNFLTRFYTRNTSTAAGEHVDPLSHRERRARSGSEGQPRTEHRQPPSPGYGAPGDADAANALQMDLFTLRKMAAGGIHDHIGGGFHRYSVDRYWHVPHFEKMLYDQAQLAVAYLDAFQILSRWSDADSDSLAPRERRTRSASEGKDEASDTAGLRRNFELTARDILDYVARDMTSPEGGFYSAEDADSLEGAAPSTPQNQGGDSAPPSKTEGAFYVWTEKEIDDALGPDADLFDYYYGVQPHGNAPEGSDPQDEFRGKNILIERHTVAETAQHFKRGEDEIRQLVARSREKLLSIRGKRPHPHLDDKIIAAWNGLMISAYARAAQVLDEPRYLESAARAARFVRTNLYDEKSKLLYRSYREGRGEVEGFADDYAFVIQGLLDLYEVSFDVEWLKFAVELQKIQDRLFFDEKNGGYFTTSGKDSSVLLRMKDDNDSAEPAASSVAALNLLRLGQILNDREMEDRAKKTISTFAPALSHFASAMPQMLVALDYSLNKPRQIVIAGKPDAPGTKALMEQVRRHFLPYALVMLADGGDGQKYLSEKNEAIRSMSPIDGKPAAYVCENFTCKAPVTDPKALAALLK
jgi:uncharacterized protein YyaL (SSP411 family)